MNKRIPYSYSILRYVHDVATGEFVNVGVVVHSAESTYFEARCRTTYKRVSEFFPDLDTRAFRALMKQMNSRLRELSEAYNDSLNVEPNGEPLSTLLKRILPEDDSALRWTPPAGGLTGNIRAVLSSLYDRYVTRHDAHNATARRTDADVWRHFSRELDRRHISNYFVEKTIEGHDDKVKFKSAWKNGIWHCIEPLSFDLAASESIKEKARLFLGQMTSVSDTNEEVKLYVVLGKPSSPELYSAYERAVQIIRKIKFPQEIYTEEEIDLLANKFQEQITHHEQLLQREKILGTVRLSH